MKSWSRSRRVIGKAAGIVDGDVEIFPAGASLVALAGAIASDAVTDTVDAAAFLDVEADEFAGFLALMANDFRLGFERTEPSKTEPAQHGADGGARQAEFLRDLWAGASLATQALDGGQYVGVDAVPASETLVVERTGGSGGISHPPAAAQLVLQPADDRVRTTARPDHSERRFRPSIATSFQRMLRRTLASAPTTDVRRSLETCTTIDMDQVV